MESRYGNKTDCTLAREVKPTTEQISFAYLECVYMIFESPEFPVWPRLTFSLRSAASASLAFGLYRCAPREHSSLAVYHELCALL